jgi:hypothetical protein
VETLLATCASAGATLVAIIGGLLISRYLTIDSEVRGAAQQLASVTARLTDAKSESDRAEREAAIYDMEWSFDDSDIYEELRKAARGQPLDLEKVKRIDSSLTAYADEQILATAEPWLQEIRVAYHRNRGRTCSETTGGQISGFATLCRLRSKRFGSRNLSACVSDFPNPKDCYSRPRSSDPQSMQVPGNETS